MEGWRQKRQLGVQSNRVQTGKEMNCPQLHKNGLTPTGLLMEGQCAHRAVGTERGPNKRAKTYKYLSKVRFARHPATIRKTWVFHNAQ
jgi:hypothetical protein